MSEQQQIERDDALSIYEPDPFLGDYVAHHPSNRLRLLIIGASLYAVPVLILQIIFFNTQGTLVDIALPIAFAAIAGAVLWWVLHHWNREVVLYERGFSYRQGSTTAYILYANVIKLIQNIERVGFLGLSRVVYDYELRTDVDESLTIDNVYSDPAKLTRALEVYIARDRLPILLDKMAEGEQVTMGDNLHISKEGIILNDKRLLWEQFKAQRVKEGQLYLQTKNDDEWGIISVENIDNPVLLIALLRRRGQTTPEAP